jgi:hypothetical protein
MLNEIEVIKDNCVQYENIAKKILDDAVESLIMFAGASHEDVCKLLSEYANKMSKVSVTDNVF